MQYRLMPLLSLLGLAVSLSTPGNAIAQPVLPGTLQVAQNSLIGECRAVNRQTFVYSDRTEANPITSLSDNTEVILQGEGRNGWIVVSVPSLNQAGFVRTNHLKNCLTANSNNPDCRRIIYSGEEGMVIRANPSTRANQVGSLTYGERLTIDPSETFRDSIDREWVELVAPLNGWMSNGLPGTSNLGLCP